MGYYYLINDHYFAYGPISSFMEIMLLLGSGLKPLQGGKEGTKVRGAHSTEERKDNITLKRQGATALFMLLEEVRERECQTANNT